MTDVALAEVKTWDGGAATTSWHDDANWSPDGVPLELDDVTISGAVFVEHSMNVTLVNTLEVNGGAELTVSGGSLSTTGDFHIDNSRLDYTGGTLGSQARVENSTLFIGPGGTNAANFLMQRSSTLEGTVASGQEVWVRGGSDEGHATLTLADGCVNGGTIRCETLNASWDSVLLVPENATFTNDAGGLLQINHAGGGTRRINGVGAWTFQNNGDIVTVDGSFPINAGAYRHGGGTHTGDVYMDDCTIVIEATATDVTELAVTGVSTLLQHDSTDVTLWVRGNGGTGHSTLFVGSFTNNGPIRFETVTGGWDSVLRVNSNELFTNGPTGSLSFFAAGGGSRNITGTDAWAFRNFGTITTDALNFSVFNGTYYHGGGMLTGDFVVDDCFIAIESTATTPVTIAAVDNCTLLEHEVPDITLWVRGQGGTGPASLNVTGITNHGHIVLESTGSSWNSDLAIDLDGLFVNAADGVIDVNLGTAGARLFVGSGDWGIQNHGAINVEAGILCNSNGDGLTFEQLDGSVVSDGEFSMRDGTFVFAGGALEGNVIADDCAIIVEATATIPSTLATNDNCTLLQHDSPTTTVWVQGRNGLGSAILNVGELLNHGTIKLESLDGAWISRMIVAESVTFTNAATGVIDVNLGTGGDRNLTGSGDWIFRNLGTIDVEAIAFNMFDATYEHAGGTIVGDFHIDDCFVSVEATATTPATILLHDTCVLLSHESPAVNLQVQGRNGTGAAILFCGDVTNNGTITCESIDSTWDSRIRFYEGATFVNGPNGTININLGAAGNRDFNGLDEFWTFRNEGQLNIEAIQCRILDGTFVYASGDIDGELTIDDASISVEAGATSEVTILIHDTCTLIGHESPSVTLWVQGRTGTGAASLVVGDVISNGPIRLESIDSTWPSNLNVAVDTTFTNGPTGTVDCVAGSGGDRRITGDFVNEGLVRPGFPSHLRVNGNFTQTETGTFGAEFGGELDGEFTRLIVDGDADIDGAIQLSRVDKFIPTPDLELVVMDVDGELMGTFIDVTSCDPVNVISNFKTDEVIVTFGEASDVTGDITGDGSVDVNDLLLLLSQWGMCPDGQFQCCPGDLNESGSVDVNDLLLLLANWS